MTEYNSTYYDPTRNILKFKNEGKVHESINVFPMPDGTLIGIFQGEKGDNPKLDFVVKFLVPGKKTQLRTPKNVHWVVDILMIGRKSPKGAAALVDDLLACYADAEAFADEDERAAFSPQKAREIAAKFNYLNRDASIPVDFVTHVVELFSICEKASPRDNKMFEKLLSTLKEHYAGTKDYYQVLSATPAGYRKG